MLKKFCLMCKLNKKEDIKIVNEVCMWEKFFMYVYVSKITKKEWWFVRNDTYLKKFLSLLIVL